MKEKRSRMPLLLAAIALVLVTFIAAMTVVPEPTVIRVEEPLKAEAFLR